MKPEEVTYGKFKCDVILYDSGECSEGFSIAYGKYDGGKEPVIAMRWNGKGTGVGYPRKDKEPRWMVVHDELKIPFLKSILGNENAKSDKVLDIILRKYKLIL